MKRISVTMLAALLVSCASPYTQVDESIVAEMDSAARQAASSQPAAVREALLPPLRAEIPKVPGASAEPRFDLVVNAAPAQQVFMSVVSGTRYSMVVNPEVSGRLSLNLKDVTVREALEAIREVYGYEFRVDGTRIYVEAAGMQTRVFHVSYLAGLRTGRSDVRVSSGSTSGIVAGQPTAGGGAAAPVAAGAAQPGQNVNTIGLGQLNQITNDATRVSTFSQSDFWQELTTAVRTLVGTGTGRSIVVSPQSGVVVIRAMPQEIRSVESYLKAIRVSVERQVMLEAKIIDVTLNDAYQAGVNWAGFSGTRFSGGVQGAGTTLGTTGALVSSSPLGLTANPAARTVVSTTASAAASAATAAAGAAGMGVFGLALQTRNFASLLQFLESQGTTQVLSSPRVATLNNQKAVLKVGTDDFFVTNVESTPVVSSISGVPIGATLKPTLSSFFSGVSLDITPQIDEDGNINLHIHPLVSKVENGSLTFDFGTGIGITNIPTAKSTINETDTMVRVQDGNIVALGGLMQLELENSRSGIPGVQQIPGVGGLFGNRARNLVKKELVILIKPTVIKSEADWEQDITATGDRLRSMGSGAPARTPRSQ
jgi:MSHA biogenesis protein MshL